MIELLNDFDGLLSQLGREVDEVVDGEALPVIGRWLRGHRLGRRSALTYHR